MMTGLRERKKQQTRDALVDAAFDLFARKGFEATTVDEIAEAVTVSSRTFFRYFASKDDVVIGAVDDLYTLAFAAYDARPAGEPVVTALRHAMVGVLRACEDGEAALPPERLVCLTQLMASSPSLAAHSLERCTVRLAELAGKIGARMGVEPRSDPRPTLVAAVAMSAVQTATGAWREDEPDTPPSVLVERAFTLLEEGINYPAARSHKAGRANGGRANGARTGEGPTSGGRTSDGRTGDGRASGARVSARRASGTAR
jgi:AcrR family transcriptional regulator